jgi:hypothetical protein
MQHFLRRATFFGHLSLIFITGKSINFLKPISLGELLFVFTNLSTTRHSESIFCTPVPNFLLEKDQLLSLALSLQE